MLFLWKTQQFRNYEQILSAIRILPVAEQSKLIIELTKTSSKEDFKSSRQEKLIDKQVGCPHCNSIKFTRFGKDKGSFRFKCKECNRTFTKHKGTWLAGLHKNELVNDYLELMYQEKSLDKIKVALSINKKTAFDRPHKILSSYQDVDKNDFNGIVGSDETFFLQSEKGRI